MNPSLISIIIPVYNHAKELVPCIESLKNQTYKSTEIIVVDDGSNIPVVCNSNVTLIRQENKGGNAARNLGFDASHGSYILFSDADIVFQAKALEMMYEALTTNPEAAYSYSSFKFGFKKFECGTFDEEKLKRENFIHTTSLIRRDLFPGFDESLKRFQDWDLWLTMLEQGSHGIFIPEVLFSVKPRKAGISQWLPSFAYRFKWLDAVKRHDNAKKIVFAKHHLPVSL